MNSGSPPLTLQSSANANRPSRLGGAATSLVALSLLSTLAACGHPSAQPSADAGSAPAPAATGQSGANPILGKWTLIDTNNAAYCQTSQEFTADSSTFVKGGTTSTAQPIYDVKPTAVYVSYGGPNMEEWDVTGPDDLTLQLTSPYSVMSCRYHRA
jgi:hypothetical protein